MDNLALDPQKLIAQLGDEIGILSVRMIQSTMQLELVASLYVQAQNANANLTLALEAKDKDIKAMRETLNEQAEKLGITTRKKK